MRFFYLSTLLLLSTFLACKKTINPTCDNSPFSVIVNQDFEKEPKTNQYENTFLIINEGGFTYGNSSISSYNPTTNTIEKDIFFSVNGYKLGDITQSINKQNELSFVVVNNSQKIEIVKTASFERLRTITGFSSPRYIEFISEKEALISDLYENSIQVINTEDACVVGKITTKGWTEELMKIGSEFWAIERNSIGASTKFANLILLNTTDFSIEKRIAIPVEPNSIIEDKDNNLWILSSGFEAENQLPELIKINTQTKNITQQFSFSSYNNVAQNLAYNANTDLLYYNKANSIYSMQATDSYLPIAAIFSSAAQIVYGLDVDINSGELYICDALDYISKGKVLRYSASGNFISEFPVGILPNKVVF